MQQDSDWMYQQVAHIPQSASNGAADLVVLGAEATMPLLALLGQQECKRGRQLYRHELGHLACSSLRHVHMAIESKSCKGDHRLC